MGCGNPSPDPEYENQSYPRPDTRRIPVYKTLLSLKVSQRGNGDPRLIFKLRITLMQ